MRQLELPAAAQKRDVLIAERRGGSFRVVRDVDEEALSQPQEVVVLDPGRGGPAIPLNAEAEVHRQRPLVVRLDDHFRPAGCGPRRDAHRVQESRSSQDDLGLLQPRRIEDVADLEEEQPANEVLAREDVQGVGPAIGPRGGRRVVQVEDVGPVDPHRHDRGAGSHVLHHGTRGAEPEEHEEETRGNAPQEPPAVRHEHSAKPDRSGLGRGTGRATRQAMTSSRNIPTGRYLPADESTAAVRTDLASAVLRTS